MEEPAYVGIKETLLSSPRLDNQTSVAALLAAIVEGTRTDGINLIALFDNEEIGNTSKQGAASILLHDMVKRIYRSLGCSEEETDCAMYGGMLLSVDVAHALHPNHKEKMDITNHPVLGDGFCIKEACSQSYATDAKAIGILRQLCDQNKNRIPEVCQSFRCARGWYTGIGCIHAVSGPHSGYWNSALIDAFCTGTDGTNGF